MADLSALRVARSGLARLALNGILAPLSEGWSSPAHGGGAGAGGGGAMMGAGGGGSAAGGSLFCGESERLPFSGLCRAFFAGVSASWAWELCELDELNLILGAGREMGVDEG